MTDKMTEEEVNKILNNPKQKRHEITITIDNVVYIMCDCGDFYINNKFHKKIHLKSNSHNGFN